MIRDWYREVALQELKPANIMLTKTGAKLMDFGLAKALPAQAPPALGVTMTSSVPSPGQPLTAQDVLLAIRSTISPIHAANESMLRTNLTSLTTTI
jgi:eukaryotic-like serine/threonine-protein kinase